MMHPGDPFGVKARLEVPCPTPRDTVELFCITVLMYALLNSLAELE